MQKIIKKRYFFKTPDYICHFGGGAHSYPINTPFFLFFGYYYGKYPSSRSECVVADYLDDMNRHKNSNIIDEIQDKIKENCADKNLSLNFLAHMMDKSPAYIGRLFKEKTNRSVSEYILFVRMEKLRDLLDTTTQPVNVLLEQVGLEKNNYFYTLFKKHFGVPLSSYKRKNME